MNNQNNIDKLGIYIPTLKDLWFRQKMMADKKTMDYNIGFEPYDGYNPKDGTIDFAKDKWQNWFDFWIGNKDSRCFYAYIIRICDGKWIGDIAYRYDKKIDKYAVHIVIDNEYRGQGYSRKALRLLCEVARKNGIRALFNDIPLNRKAAIKTHLNCGFVEIVNDGKNSFLVNEFVIT